MQCKVFRSPQSVAGTPMVKSLCTARAACSAGLCVELLAARVKIDGNTSIPQPLLTTIHTGGQHPSAFLVISGVWQREQRIWPCLQAAQGNVLGKFGQLRKQAELSVHSGEMEPN